MNLTEFELIEQLKSLCGANQAVLQGVGDDCAVLPYDARYYQLISTDILIEDVHFDLSQLSLEQIGYKALAVNISDIAAMGGIAEYLTVALGLPAHINRQDIPKLYQGMQPLLKQFNIQIVGGDVSQAKKLTLSGTVVGKVEQNKIVYRSGAKEGDMICVTGSLGGSYAQKHFSFTPRIQEARWLVEHCKPTAMMDISDGLAGDLRHILKASNCSGAILNEGDIPLSSDCQEENRLEQALCQGEDFELLFTVAPDQLAMLKKAPFSWSKVGVVDNQKEGLWILSNQGLEAFLKSGYCHLN